MADYWEFRSALLRFAFLSFGCYRMFCICLPKFTFEWGRGKGLSAWPITTGVIVPWYSGVVGNCREEMLEEELSRTCFVELKKSVYFRVVPHCLGLQQFEFQKDKVPFSLQNSYITHPTLMRGSGFAEGFMIGCSMFCVFYVFSSAFMHTECVCVSQSLSLSQKVPVRTTSRSPVLSRRDSPHHHGNASHSSHAVQRNTAR